MDTNRFKELLESTMGDVRPLISEQNEMLPDSEVAPAQESSLDPKIVLVRETINIINKTNPITDKETEKNIKNALKYLFGAKPYDTKGLDERMKAYNYGIKKYNLYNYLPSMELIAKLKEVN